ncbi:hypothetical protein GKG47_11940 [Lactonifactor sp. BIOML-A3]|uniref:hypothetical protein n=1 Tax=unclassified Lactonifactor TaxID=2636670 RepID=UPI0012AFAEB8|nr:MULTISPECIES: hypothetical protein [unclassified Lactonifactor]MSA01029.1 hypothetical protein [Lactonifactor sp. BIOML-A5]MSA10325.1 hypothetical protein [Lactonifactor sp. BIOML-A4]MSA13135.1 hypothetical protein [Lactonifactor sp. BIOML-A3]MSA19297.1 hypothetical protein [Lactonifactor sp. BIOML-A2]MSA38374.1 hypothetical protein [Lactonifactor sp. BIOML-A1]
MLKTSKSISLTGNSMIGEKSVLYMSATINTADGRSNSSTTVQNMELYEANKTECRQDEDDFKAMVRELEDSINTVNTEVTQQ